MDRPIGKKQRLDPYRNYRFRLKLDGQTVAGFSGVVNPSRSLERGGPGTVTLQRGSSHNSAFTQWAGISKNSRKDLTLEMYGETGQLAKSYRICRSWISEYQAVPELDAGANAVAIQEVKIEHEGWIPDE